MADYAVVDPATGETIKTYPTITDEQLDGGDRPGRRGAPGVVADGGAEEQAAVLRRVGELHVERRGRKLAEIIVREMGKPLEQALDEAGGTDMIYNYYADHAEEFLADQPLQLPYGGGSALVRRSSLGVLLGIMPWNYPYYQVMRFAAPNLLLGNTMLVKHAPQCPESAEAIEQIFRDAGLPDGVYINVRATVEQIKWVIGDPRIRGVSVTGSQRAGSEVAEIAGRHLKEVVLELGGSDPFIVLATEDLDRAVEIGVAARFDNTGQACNAAKRFIIIDDL